MADDSLIDAYLEDLAAALRWHRDADDIVAETNDHVRCAVDRRIGDGIDQKAAQRDVLEGFGDPAMVALAYATTRSGRLALPTRSTRDAGVLAYTSAALWLAVPVVWQLGGWLYDRVRDETTPADQVGNNAELLVIVAMTMTLLGAAVTLLATVMILRVRHGGFGLPGMLGIGALALGCAATMFGWFLIGWGGLLIAGTALVAVDVLRRGIAPKRAALTIGTGLAIGGVTWAALRLSEVGGPDQHGDYLVANGVGVAIGSIMLATGLVGIGRWLANEQPVELSEPTPLAHS